MKKNLPLSLVVFAIPLLAPLMITSYNFDNLHIAAALIALLGVFLLNHHLKVSLLMLGMSLLVFIITFFAGGGVDSLINGRYSYYYSFDFSDYQRVLECLLGAVIILGINKGKKPVAVLCALLFVVLDLVYLLSSSPDLPAFYGDSTTGSVILWIAHYSKILLPLILLFSVSNARRIRNCIKVITGYLAVRLMLYIAGDLLILIMDGGYYGTPHLNIGFLIENTFMPMMLILGLNAFLFFPISFRELAKVFGFSLLIVGLFAVMAAVQQGFDSSSNESSEMETDFAAEIGESISTWNETMAEHGYIGGMNRDNAHQMLVDGRITQQQYFMLLSMLKNKARSQ